MKVLIPTILLVLASACDTPTPEPKPSPEPPAVPSGLFELEFDKFRTELNADPPIPKQVLVTIRKKDPITGPVQWSAIYFEGDRIGWNDEDGIVTSVHWAYSANLSRTVKVDFDTGAVLVKIQMYKEVPCQTGFCKVRPRVGAGMQCEGEHAFTANALVNEVIYKDSQRGFQVVHQPVGLDRPPDYRCVLHGGKRLAQTIAAPENVRRKWIAWEAGSLLWKADGEWKSKNPKVRTQAREIYRRLLAEYPSEAIVDKNRERIKARSEADIED